MNFTRCPFCAGHETVSSRAATYIAELLAAATFSMPEHDPRKTELENIRNAILNQEERHEPMAVDLLPVCPTPQKRKYSNVAHASADAAKWRQYAYECPCSYWHLSKQTATEHAAKISAPAASADEFEPIDPLLT